MISPVPNGEQLKDGEVRAGSSADVDIVENSEGSNDDSEESEDEVQSPHSERRSKRGQDPEAVPSKTVASSTRNMKHGWAAMPESTEKATKQPRYDAPKPRKALPRMKIQVPVAST
jgi:hypothetical protein